MIKVEIIRQTVADRRNVRVGDVVELSDRDANLLIGSRKAIRVRGDAPPPEVSAPAPVAAPAPRRKKGQS